MLKNQLSQGAHARALSTVNRPLFWARFFLLASFLALGILSLQPQGSAQAAGQALRGEKAVLSSPQAKPAAPNCPACEQALVECLAAGGSNCLAQYDACCH